MENPNTQPEREGREPEKKATESYLYDNPPSRRGLYTVIALIVLLILAAFFVRGHWLRIHVVEAPGVTRYTAEEIAAKAGITDSATYFNLSESRIRANIEKDRYLRFESMEKVFPDKVILHIEERKETYNFINMGIQYVLSRDGMVLSSSNRMTPDNGCLNVSGINTTREIWVGAPVPGNNAEQIDAMDRIYAELCFRDMQGEISELNVSSLDSIYLVTLDGFTVNIGDADELRGKIGTVYAVLRELRAEGETGGMIEATAPGRAFFQPPK